MSLYRNLNISTKIIIIVIVSVIVFLLTFLLSSEFLLQESSWGMGRMSNHMGANTDYRIVILLSLTIALIGGLIVTLWIKPTTNEIPKTTSPKKMDELEIIKRVLSEDEKAVVNEVRKAGEITQDSLRFRLEWSKSKLSRILTNLDKLNIIQRERLGKTYKIFLTKNQSDE